MTESQSYSLQKDRIEWMLSNGMLRKYETVYTTDAFLAMKRAYSLGDGETECLVICTCTEFLLGCDDRKARECAIQIIDSNRVHGSLYILKEAVISGTISSTEAWDAYLMMKSQGGFLPELSNKYFDVL